MGKWSTFPEGVELLGSTYTSARQGYGGEPGRPAPFGPIRLRRARFLLPRPVFWGLRRLARVPALARPLGLAACSSAWRAWRTSSTRSRRRLPDIYASGDQDAVRTAGKRHSELKPIIDTFRELRTARTQLEEAREMLRTRERRRAAGAWPGRRWPSRNRPWPTSRAASRCCSSRRTRTTTRTSSSRSGAPRAARRPTSSPATSCGCTRPTPPSSGGRSRCSPASRPTWAASRRRPSW